MFKTSNKLMSQFAWKPTNGHGEPKQTAQPNDNILLTLVHIRAANVMRIARQRSIKEMDMYGC